MLLPGPFDRALRKNNKQSYTTKYPGSTLVLYAKDGTPIVALALSTPSAQSIVTERQDKVDGRDCVQAMISKKDTKFSWWMTNLTDNTIKIDLYRSPKRIDNTNPGGKFALNKVNELHAYESYEMCSDQANSMCMVLGGLDTVSSTGKKSAVTVNEDLAKPQSERAAFSIHPVVTAMRGSSTIETMKKGTVWKCVNTVVIDVQPEPEVFVDANGYRSVNQSCTIQQRNESYTFGSEQSCPIQEDSEEEEDGDCPSWLFDESTTTHAPVDIGLTQAGVLKYGEKDHVRSGETGCTYDYSATSVPTVIGMSIWPKMDIFPFPDLYEMATAHLEDVISHNSARLLASIENIFTSETCCIDCVSTADTIMVPCGHKCVHHSNVENMLRKCGSICPICRGHVTSHIVV